MKINGAAMKAKGSAFEREVVRALKRLGFPYAERAYGAGRPHDVGDIDGVPGLVFECKARRALELAAWVDEAQREAANAGAVGVVVAKRRGRPTEDAYVVLSLSDFAALMVRSDARVPSQEPALGNAHAEPGTYGDVAQLSAG
jgi:Holliday junction resolvase